MTRGETFTTQDGQGQQYDCEVVWSGTKGEPGLLSRWPTHSSLLAAGSVQPAKGRKGMTPTPVSPK